MVFNIITLFYNTSKNKSYLSHITISFFYLPIAYAMQWQSPTKSQMLVYNNFYDIGSATQMLIWSLPFSSFSFFFDEFTFQQLRRLLHDRRALSCHIMQSLCHKKNFSISLSNSLRKRSKGTLICFPPSSPQLIQPIYYKMVFILLLFNYIKKRKFMNHRV